mgnify:CR=1 FL=1
MGYYLLNNSNMLSIMHCDYTVCSASLDSGMLRYLMYAKAKNPFYKRPYPIELMALGFILISI